MPRDRERQREYNRHYKRFGPIGQPTAEERYWSKVDKSADLNACWPWLGSHYTNGYAYLVVKRRHVKASRFAVRLDGRDVGPGLVVMHACDNPSCVNPRHLIVGTQSDNMRDMVAKGRHGYVRTQEIRARQSAASKAMWAARKAV